MLVYLKEDMGYTKVGSYRVYGKYFNYGKFGPANIPVELYKENMDILKEAEYTKRWLEDKFGDKFPDVSFTISKLYKLDITTIIRLARCMGIDYIGKNKMTRQEKVGLKKSIVNALK